jgi:hypothetical protein
LHTAITIPIQADIKLQNNLQYMEETARNYDQSAESKASDLFLQFIHNQKKPRQSMKNYLEKIIELGHDLRIYNIDLSELAICIKALDGLPQEYKQIKATARTSQIKTISRLMNLLSNRRMLVRSSWAKKKQEERASASQSGNPRHRI